MTKPNFGMTFSRNENEILPVSGADFSKILLIETSADADATAFPEGKAVRFSTSDAVMVGKLGTGLLADAVKGIRAQLVGVNSGADITAVRVKEGANAAATAASIADALDPAKIAAIPSEVGATPRLVWAGRTALAMTTGGESPEPITNVVVAALPAALETLMAIAVVDVAADTAANAITDREKMNSERMMPIGIAAKVLEGGSVVTRPMGPRILGLIASVDNNHGGKPFQPFANRPIYGLVGLSRALPFSLLDGSTEGQQLLEADVSIVVAGETGVDGAVADGGFTFIGTDNTATGDLWKQIHQVRGSDYIVVKLIRLTKQFLGRRISADSVEAWLNSMRFVIRDHVIAEDLLGGEVKFLKSKNSPENIRLGDLTVNLGIEPLPAFKVANHEIARYRPALEDMVNTVIARLNAATQ